MMMTKRIKNFSGFIKTATKLVRIFHLIMWGVGVSLAGTLFVAALVNIAAVASVVAKCKYGELQLGEGDGDSVWWLLGGATGVSMTAIWIAIWVHMNSPRYRTTGKIALSVVMAALAAVITAGDLDLDLLFGLIDAMNI